MIDKQEFMAVSGMNRMAYNDQYIIGQRGDNLFFINLEMSQCVSTILNLKCNKT